MRSKKVIEQAENEHFERLWLHRTEQLVEEVGPYGLGKYSGQAMIKAREMVNKYGEEAQNLDLVDQAYLSGKLSALRWVLGSEWDMLDT